MSMNLQQTRVVDPVLTGIAQGYTNPNRVGHVLFPKVDVTTRGGIVLEFGKEAFRAINARRAPGASTKTVAFGYGGKPFQLVQDALNAPVPRELLEDAKSVPGLDLGTRATNRVMDMLTLALEIEQADLARNAANYPNDHVIVYAGDAGRWDYGGSDPVKQIAEAKEIARAKIGVEPNRMVLGMKPFLALRNHSTVKENFKYTSSDSITTKMLAAYLELDEIAVGKATVLPENAEDTSPATDVWGNDAILAYTPEKPTGVEQPSFGYTYTLKGHPFVENAVWDNDTKSWVYGVTYERKPVIAGMMSGILMRNVLRTAN